jgi:hypothetical protein
MTSTFGNGGAMSRMPNVYRVVGQGSPKPGAAGWLCPEWAPRAGWPTRANTITSNPTMRPADGGAPH